MMLLLFVSRLLSFVSLSLSDVVVCVEALLPDLFEFVPNTRLLFVYRIKRMKAIDDDDNNNK